jgi:hypothetical protein
MQDETLVYDEHNHRAHCLNASAALIWKSCDGTRTISEIANQVSRELDVPVTDEIVLNAIDKLSRRHLMTEPSRPSVRRSALTRRQVLRNLGRGAVVAIPVITSILAPHAAQAGTCLPSGATCSTSAQCCSGVCNVNVCA